MTVSIASLFGASGVERFEGCELSATAQLNSVVEQRPGFRVAARENG
ncbi:hypothetical protein [Streptomyces caeruleatus]|jgi:hypothetical protein|nr:hypothetical protein [Streptomyces caeruleatus]